MTPEELVRFQSYVDVEATTGCWLWSGRKSERGYGLFYIGGRGHKAHILAFEHFRGARTPGLVLDHRVCDTPACCNPNHLVECTIGENVLRGRGLTAQQARATRCKNGHPFDEVNTGTWKGHRYCRACQRDRMRRLRAERTVGK